MSYLSLLIALFRMGSVPEGVAWLDVYLDALVRVESMFLKISWWIWGAALAVTLILTLLSVFGREPEGISIGLGCGCLVVILLSLPLFEWLTLVLARGMAEAVGPQGVIDSGKFWVHLIIYILIGIG